MVVLLLVLLMLRVVSNLDSVSVGARMAVRFTSVVFVVRVLGELHFTALCSGLSLGNFRSQVDTDDLDGLGLGERVYIVMLIVKES